MIDRLFPTRHHLGLKFLGHKDWLKVSTNPETGIECQVQKDFVITEEDKRKYRKEDIEDALSLLTTHCDRDTSSAFFLYEVAQAIAYGPKLFRPTYEQCLALEHTSINFGFEDFHQPFPTVILELPKEYRDRLKIEYKSKEVPTFVLSYKFEEAKVLVVSSWFSHTNVIINVLGNSPEHATIEDALVANRKRYNSDIPPTFDKLREAFGVIVEKIAEPPPAEEAQTSPPLEYSPDIEFDVAEVVQRLGINFAMMMTLLGIRVTEPANITQDKIEKYQRTLGNKKSNPIDKERAARMLAGATYLTKFVQNIDFYEIQKPAHSRSGEGHTGIKLKWHWRKGHYQHYWIAQDHEEFERAFIMPNPPGMSNRRKLWKFKKGKMVHQDLFESQGGDPSETTVIYTAKGVSPEKR
jgi:hypothetical protein